MSERPHGDSVDNEFRRVANDVASIPGPAPELEDLLSPVWTQTKEKSMSNGRNAKIVAVCAAAVALIVGLAIVFGIGGSEVETINPPETTTTESPVVDPTTTTMSTTTTTTTTTTEAPPIVGFPDGAAQEFSGPPMIDVTDERAGQPVAGGMALTITGVLQAADGTDLDGRVTILDLREPGGSVECAGQVYDGPFTMTTDQISTGAIEIVGLGKMNVRFEAAVLVGEAEAGLPICHVLTGSWSGFSDELDGRVGRFERVLVNGVEVWRFDL